MLWLCDLQKITFLCLAVLRVVHFMCFDLTTMVVVKDAAVTRPKKSQVLAPRLRNNKRTRETTTEVPNNTTEELDIDERLDRLESRVLKLRRVLSEMLEDVRKLKAEVSRLRTGRGDAVAPEPSLTDSASSCITVDHSLRSCADSRSRLQ